MKKIINTNKYRQEYERIKEDYWSEFVEDLIFTFREKCTDKAVTILPDNDCIKFVNYSEVDDFDIYKIIGYNCDFELLLLKEEDDLLNQISNQEAYDGNFTINVDIDRIFIDKYHIKELLNLEEFNQEYNRIKNDVLNLISNFDEFSIKVNYDYDDIYPICLKEKEIDKPIEVKRLIGTKINSINSTTELKDLTVESLLNIINYLC
jgi:hypothetical protein